MPILKSAKKKMRKDKKRTIKNEKLVKAYQDIFKKIKKGKGDLKKLIQDFYSKVDKVAKKKVIHKNKANRLKAQINKLIRKVKK